MAYIYTITNKSNHKQYVGKTNRTVEQRWKEHLLEINQERSKNRPLYRAIKKYGVDNFVIEELEEVDLSEAEEKEKYWIEVLRTYKDGYNATLGGDGKTFLDYEKIIDDYKILKNTVEVADLNGCHRESVINILNQNQIPVLAGSEVTKRKMGKAVVMLDIETSIPIKTFSSQIEAARYLIENKHSNARSPSSLSSKIGLVVRGKRVTCSGFKWESV